MAGNYVYHGSGRVWLVCRWEKGPICYGMLLDIVGALCFVSFAVLVIAVIFFGWFGIFPKVIRRKLHE